MTVQPETEESRRIEEQVRRDLPTLASDVQHELGPGVEVLIRGRPLGRQRGR